MQMTHSSTVTLRFPKLHAKQQEVYDSPARFKVLAWGRQTGKSLLSAVLALECAAKGGRVAYVAPTYAHAQEIAWQDNLKPWIEGREQQLGVTVQKENLTVHFKSGGFIAVRSGDVPRRLRGRAYDLLILDEFAHFDNAEELWQDALRATLTRYNGKALIVSTPLGQNFFYNLYLKEKSDPRAWQSFHATHHDNPAIAADEREQTRKDLPKRIYEQEYLAKFLTDGALFNNLDNIWVSPQFDQKSLSIVIGVDWGRRNDSTVFTVLDKASLTALDIVRLTDADYETQTQTLWELVKQYNAETVLAESNSMGGPLIEKLELEGMPILGFNTNRVSKKALIEKLMLAFDSKRLKIARNCQAAPVLKHELQVFSCEYRDGMARYNAPTGMHDDTVISLALAVEACDQVPLFFVGHV